jgi:hypothetical protein
VRADDGKLLVRPDLMSDQVVELELDEVQKLFKVRLARQMYSVKCVARPVQPVMGEGSVLQLLAWCQTRWWSWSWTRCRSCSRCA